MPFVLLEIEFWRNGSLCSQYPPRYVELGGAKNEYLPRASSMNYCREALSITTKNYIPPKS